MKYCEDYRLKYHRWLLRVALYLLGRIMFRPNSIIRACDAGPMIDAYNKLSRINKEW
jgi:hypothetical protein